ncbi:polyphosphate kinase 2 [Sulfobacillus sp. hq2]|uniref:polyphosphate kinase 2 n=1 Tax=Sulfobacillus TaxID=28033 RepID=UPI001FA859FD|nr:polyphosphate kinase 2 [Sulfobacillus sp. hq2]
MGKHHNKAKGSNKDKEHMEPDTYAQTLKALQIELLKLQVDVVAHQRKILVIFEGRDAAGKDGTIRRFAKHMNPRQTHVVALDKPTDKESTEWYFQRYVSHLPAGGELALFNRSWYNRAGVEKVMGFCTATQYEEFMTTVPFFEQMLHQSGMKIFKYYLDINKEEQKARLEERKKDPLKRWKLSPMDEQALKHWDAYSEARNHMFARTSHPDAPWFVVKADDKRRSRLAVIQHFLHATPYEGKDLALLNPDPLIVFPFDSEALTDGRIAP